MSFFKEAADALGLDLTKIALGYEVINFGGEAIFVEGFKRLVSTTDCEIVLELKKSRIRIAGESLFIFSLEESTIIIKGKVRLYEVI